MSKCWCGHTQEEHPYDGPAGNLVHTWPCMECECRSMHWTGKCQNCGHEESAHTSLGCCVRCFGYNPIVTFTPFTPNGLAALIQARQ